MSRMDRKIRRAFEHATPDVLGSVLIDYNTDRLVLEEVPSMKPKHSRFRQLAATAAAVALLLGVGAAAAIILGSGFTLGPGGDPALSTQGIISTEDTTPIGMESPVVYYIDVTFDDYPDRLELYDSPASANYYLAYVWDEAAGEYVYAEGFETIANFSLDYANNLILSHRTASMAETYSMSYYNAEQRAFIRTNMISWSSDGFIEEKMENGQWITIAEFSTPIEMSSIPNALIPYLDDGSFWDLDSDKWDANLPRNIDDKLFAAMNDEMPFNTNSYINDTAYFSTYMYGDIILIPDSYTFVDLDGDGVDELAVRCTTDYGIYIILRYDPQIKVYYGYSLGIRSFQDVKTDGTFMRSSGVGDNSVCKLTFNEETMEIIDIAVNNDYDSIYELNGTPVTKAEMEQFWAAWKARVDCQWIKVTEPAPDVSTLETAYQALILKLSENSSDLHYVQMDIDGNGVNELIIKKQTTITVYSYNKRVTEVGSCDFQTGTLRLLYSSNPDYPGIFYFTVGGSADHYGYMTLKDGQLSFENLWEYNFYSDPPQVTELSSDKQLIEESKTAYSENQDIVFLPASTLVSQIALNFVGAAEDEVFYLSVEVEEIYLVSFVYQNTHFVFYIDAQSGSIEGYEKNDILQYVPADPDESGVYNAAIEQYNLFLNGVIPATALGGTDYASGETFYVTDMYTINLKSGINRYALLDINQDGVPELHMDSNGYDVFSVRGSELIHVCGVTPTHQHGTTCVLENGALFSPTHTTGSAYQYITVDPDFKVTVVSFFDGEGGTRYEENEIYEFNGIRVTKAEFEELTKEYFEQSNSPAAIEWFEYEN